MKEWKEYTGRNGVVYVNCGTDHGATYTVKYQDGNRNRIYKVFKNANASDYLRIARECKKLGYNIA